MGSVGLDIEMRPLVLLIGQIEYATEEWDGIETACDVLHYARGNRSDFLKTAANSAYKNVIAICRSNQYSHLSGTLDEEALSDFQNLRFICNVGCGVNNIDVQYCRQRRIEVSNTPSVGAESVADTTMFLIFGVTRRAAVPMSTARAGNWQDSCPTGLGICGKILGLVGSGEIACATAIRAQAFGMKVVYCSRADKTPNNILRDFDRLPFEDLLRVSDMISIHCPLNSETRHLISWKQLNMMKQDVVIINTARGGIINNAALCENVQNGKVWGVGLDVFEQEPAIPTPIREDERFFILPHIATRTRDVRIAMERSMIQNVTNGLTEDHVVNRVEI